MTTRQNQHERDWMSMARLVLGGLAVLLLLIFFIQNLEEVEIDFLFFTVETSMLVAMVICALLGAIAALLFERRLR